MAQGKLLDIKEHGNRTDGTTAQRHPPTFRCGRPLDLFLQLMEKEDQKSPYELDKRPPAEQYFVYNGKIDMEAHDKFGSAMKVGEDRDNRHYKLL